MPDAREFQVITSEQRMWLRRVSMERRRLERRVRPERRVSVEPVTVERRLGQDRRSGSDRRALEERRRRRDRRSGWSPLDQEGFALRQIAGRTQLPQRPTHHSRIGEFHDPS